MRHLFFSVIVMLGMAIPSTQAKDLVAYFSAQGKYKLHLFDADEIGLSVFNGVWTGEQTYEQKISIVIFTGYSL